MVMAPEAAAPEAEAPEPPVAALVAPLAAPATAQDQTTTEDQPTTEDPSPYASPPKALQMQGDQNPEQTDDRVELVEPRATTQPLAAPLVTAYVPRTRAPRPTLRRRATTNVGHHLPTFLRNAANARFFSKVADSALCVLTLALTSW